MEEELICGICQDYFLDATTLSCSHTFCRVCITDWQKKSNECPYCRISIKHLARSQALNALVNIARERYENEALKSFNKTKAKNNVSVGTSTTLPFEIPSTSGTVRKTASSLAKTKNLSNTPQLVPAQISNDNRRRILDMATVASTLTGIAVKVANKKIAEKVPVAVQLTNFLAALGSSKVLGGEMKSILQGAVYKITGRTIPDDVLDAILTGYGDASGNYTSDIAAKLITNIVDNCKITKYCYDSRDSDDDDDDNAYGRGFEINIDYID